MSFGVLVLTYYKSHANFIIIIQPHNVFCYAMYHSEISAWKHSQPRKADTIYVCSYFTARGQHQRQFKLMESRYG